MTIEQEEQRERDWRFMKALGLKTEMNVPCPGDCLDVLRGIPRRIRGSVECESGALQTRGKACELTLPSKAGIEIRPQRR